MRLLRILVEHVYVLDKLVSTNCCVQKWRWCEVTFASLASLWTLVKPVFFLFFNPPLILLLFRPAVTSSKSGISEYVKKGRTRSSSHSKVEDIKICQQKTTSKVFFLFVFTIWMSLKTAGNGPSHFLTPDYPPGPRFADPIVMSY